MEVFVPGRLCVLGEHTDWAGNYRSVNKHVCYGMTVVCATNEGLHARCGLYEPMTIRYVTSTKNHQNTTQTDNSVINLFLTNVSEIKDIAQGGGYFSYVAGTILSLLEWSKECADLLHKNGLFIDNYLTTLPMQKGLSSSAAVCTLVASSFSAVHNLCFSTADLMEIAYRGEMFTPSQCGRMDQCVAMGKDTIGLMTFTSGITKLIPLSVKQDLHFVVADLKSRKDTVMILKCLNQCYPHPKDATEFKMHNYTRRNHDISWNAVRAIETGDAALLAAAATIAQESFDHNLYDLCPVEFNSPTLRKIFHDKKLHDEELYLSVKGVGSNGDGTVQFFCSCAERQLQLRDLLNGPEYNLDAFSLTIPASSKHQMLHRRRISSAIILLDNEKTLDDNVVTIREFLLELMSLGIKSFALISSSPRNNSSRRSFAWHHDDCKGNWDYLHEMSNILESMIRCRLYCENGTDLSSLLIKAVECVVDSEEDEIMPFTNGTDESNIVYCQIGHCKKHNQCQSADSCTTCEIISACNNAGAESSLSSHIMSYTFNEVPSEVDARFDIVLSSAQEGRIVSKIHILKSECFSDMVNVWEHLT